MDGWVNEEGDKAVKQQGSRIPLGGDQHEQKLVVDMRRQQQKILMFDVPTTSYCSYWSYYSGVVQ